MTVILAVDNAQHQISSSASADSAEDYWEVHPYKKITSKS